MRRDTQQFMEGLARYGFFDPGEPVHIARAPGRLDVMGGIADYSGALVLQMPIAEAAHVALQRTAGDTLELVSVDGDEQRAVSLSARLLLATPDDARRALSAGMALQWSAYVVGPMLVALQAQQRTWRGGLRVLIDSAVPEGKGVSSSAALEVATLRAFAAAAGLDLDGPTLATLCQQAENHVAGAPCGIMDQMTSACGQAGALLALRCQPATIEGYRPVPDGLAVWGLDSGIRHAVGGSDYGAVRAGAAMGMRIIADLVGAATPPFDGFLANIPPSLFVERFAPHLPETMVGDAFIERYGSVFDPIATVEPNRTYTVFAPTAHPVGEQHRLACFAAMARQPVDDEVAALLGEMMFQSHASYGRCGVGSDGTDALVTAVREVGPAAGLYGARITGGGSGGTVAILGRADARPQVQQIADRYAKQFGHRPYLFEGSSPGAIQTPVERWRP